MNRSFHRKTQVLPFLISTITQLIQTRWNAMEMKWYRRWQLATLQRQPLDIHTTPRGDFVGNKERLHTSTGAAEIPFLATTSNVTKLALNSSYPTAPRAGGGGGEGRPGPSSPQAQHRAWVWARRGLQPGPGLHPLAPRSPAACPRSPRTCP